LQAGSYFKRKLEFFIPALPAGRFAPLLRGWPKVYPSLEGGPPSFLIGLLSFYLLS